jgi:hypothetical protein
MTVNWIIWSDHFRDWHIYTLDDRISNKRCKVMCSR